MATAKWAFTALQDAFDRLFNEWRRRTGGAASVIAACSCSGVASGFDEKMRDERKAMEIERDLVGGKSSGSTALAVVSIDSRRGLRTVPHTPASSSQTASRSGAPRSSTAVTGSNSALAAGYQAGRNLSLNRSLGGSQRKLTGS